MEPTPPVSILPRLELLTAYFFACNRRNPLEEAPIKKGRPEQRSGLKPLDSGIRGNILEFSSVFSVLEAVSMPPGHTGPRPA